MSVDFYFLFFGYIYLSFIYEIVTIILIVYPTNYTASFHAPPSPSFASEEKNPPLASVNNCNKRSGQPNTHFHSTPSLFTLKLKLKQQQNTLFSFFAAKTKKKKK